MTVNYKFEEELFYNKTKTFIKSGLNNTYIIDIVRSNIFSFKYDVYDFEK